MSSSLVDIAKGLSNNSNNTINIKVYDYNITLDKNLVEEFEKYFYEVNSITMSEALLAYQYVRYISDDTASRIVNDFMRYKLDHAITTEELEEQMKDIRYDKILSKIKL